jgi:hypothetical protein
LAAEIGTTGVIDLLFKAGASLSVVNNKVITITRLKQDATNTFDILFCLLKMTFNLKGSVYQ